MNKTNKFRIVEFIASGQKIKGKINQADKLVNGKFMVYGDDKKSYLILPEKLETIGFID